MAITATIGSPEGGGACVWRIDYDDATRAVTSTCTATQGWCYVLVQLTNTITRSVAYYPPGGGDSQNPDLAGRMTAADFKPATNGTPVILVSGVNPNQVLRIVGKAGSVGGLPFASEWSRA